MGNLLLCCRNLQAAVSYWPAFVGTRPTVIYRPTSIELATNVAHSATRRQLALICLGCWSHCLDLALAWLGPGVGRAFGGIGAQRHTRNAAIRQFLIFSICFSLVIYWLPLPPAKLSTRRRRRRRLLLLLLLRLRLRLLLPLVDIHLSLTGAATKAICMCCSCSVATMMMLLIMMLLMAPPATLFAVNANFCKNLSLGCN